jgi:hypothetical protein
MVQRGGPLLLLAARRAQRPRRAAAGLAAAMASGSVHGLRRQRRRPAWDHGPAPQRLGVALLPAAQRGPAAAMVGLPELVALLPPPGELGRAPWPCPLRLELAAAASPSAPAAPPSPARPPSTTATAASGGAHPSSPASRASPVPCTGEKIVGGAAVAGVEVGQRGWLMPSTAFGMADGRAICKIEQALQSPAAAKIFSIPYSRMGWSSPLRTA